MTLKHLKKREFGRSDTRRIIVDNEKKSASRVELSESDYQEFLKYAKTIVNTIDRVSEAMRLKFLFPEKTESIIAELNLAEHLTVNAFSDEIFKREARYSNIFSLPSMHCLSAAAHYKLIAPGLDFTGIVPDPMNCIHDIEIRFISKSENNFGLQIAFLYLQYFKILYPDFAYDYSAYWEKYAITVLDYLAEKNDWSNYELLLAALRILFPERIKEINYQNQVDALIRRLTEKKSSRERIHEVYNLTIICAKEVRLDNAGLHLLNQPISGSLETAVPAQPETLNI